MKAVLGALAAALTLAACSGASPTLSPSAYPTLCPTIAAAPPVLVSPTNGATGVAAANVTVVLANFAGNENVALLTSTSGFFPSTIVAGVGTTSFAFGNVMAATTYTVVVSGIPQGCGSTTATIGTFTTK